MSERRKSFVNLLKPPRLFTRNKQPKIKPAKQCLPNHLTLPTDPPSPSTVTESVDTEPTDATSIQTIETGKWAYRDDDAFEMFLQISNSPTSTPRPSNAALASVHPKRSSTVHTKIHPRTSFYDMNTNAMGDEDISQSDDLRRVASMFDRRSKQERIVRPEAHSGLGASPYENSPEHPQPTSFRRDQARASFRSRSVRERTGTKKLHRRRHHEFGEFETHARMGNLPGDGNPLGCDTGTNDGNDIDDYEMEKDEGNLYRVRSFKVTNKGVMNLGDTFRARSMAGLPLSTLGQTHSKDRSHSVYLPRDTPKNWTAYGNQSGLDPTSATGARNRVASMTPRMAIERKLSHRKQPPEYVDDIILKPNSQLGKPDITLWQEGDTENVAINDVEIPKPPIGGTSDSGSQPIRIQVVGATNVGKTALCRQLITSEFLGARMESISEDTVERYVTVELDQQTWNVILIDNFGEAGAAELALVQSIRTRDQQLDSLPNRTTTVVMLDRDQNVPQVVPNSRSLGSNLFADALVYLFVYAVDDQKSYDFISSILKNISKDKNWRKDKVLVLVANKSDLVRCRLVSSEKGKRLAHSYHCSYFEISTAINHLVDELLVEVILQVKQIRRKYGRRDPPLGMMPNTERRLSSIRMSGEALLRYVRRQFVAKSIDTVQQGE